MKNNESSQKIALITGANRGIGKELVKALSQKNFLVILACRNEEQGETLALEIQEHGGYADFVPMDLQHKEEREEGMDYIFEKYGSVDVLINNAGVWLDPQFSMPHPLDASPLKVSEDMLRHSLEVNALAPYFLIQRCLPSMIRRNYGRIVNLSTELSLFKNLSGNYSAYTLSKSLLNAITCSFSSFCVSQNILINAVYPGWVKTDMGGPKAPLLASQVVQDIIYAAMLEESGPRGKLLYKKKILDW